MKRLLAFLRRLHVNPYLFGFVVIIFIIAILLSSPLPK